MIDVSKLTAEQLDDAQAIFSKLSTSPDFVHKNFREAFRDAAVYLQVPWDAPTEDEWQAATDVVVGQANLAFSGYGYRVALSSCIAKEFVRSRNAALLPQPVDPRVEKLACRFQAELQMSCDNQRTTSIEFVLAKIAIKELLG